MTGGKILDRLTIVLVDRLTGDQRPLYVDVFDNSLSHKWLAALNDVIVQQLVLEKNYCFLGFAQSARDGHYILDQINVSIAAINQANIGYQIDDHFTFSDCITHDPEHDRATGSNLVQERFNWLHRYFEDLQGTSGHVSSFYQRADATTRWHIRQLNLLCHEFEAWAISYRKQTKAPEWQRHSQLMCWLRAPRFQLQAEDFELFGIETLNRDLGGVYVGVNKAVGKHHWEVFHDEGRDSRINELISTTMRAQTEAAADFDIEWSRNPAQFAWQQEKLQDFRDWLEKNGFDPDNKALTIGHPQIGQVDLMASFGTEDFCTIWECLNRHLDVWKISTSECEAVYDYHWSDSDFQQRQILALSTER